MGVIYKTTNLVNNKIYIGKRIFNQDKFFRNKYYGSGKLLKESINKYGLENFNREILEEVDNELLEEREIYWIKFYNSNNLEIGYNLTIGGNSKYGRKVGSMSDKTKKKISDSVSKYLSDNGHPFQDKNHSDETKERIKNKLKGRKLSDEHIRRLAEGHRGLKYNKPPKKVKYKIDQSIKIKQFSLKGDFIKEWDSIMDAAKNLKLDRTGISRACRGIYKQCGEYIWVINNKEI
jgi:group I intron endonuclease